MPARPRRPRPVRAGVLVLGVLAAAAVVPPAAAARADGAVPSADEVPAVVFPDPVDAPPGGDAPAGDGRPADVPGRAEGEGAVGAPAADGAPVVVSEPVDATVRAGERAEFEVAATGVEPLTALWEWQYAAGDGTTWRETTEPTSREWRFVTPVRELSFDGFRYRAVVTDAHGRSTASATAVVHVTPQAPAFAEHPRSAVALDGEPVALSAALVEPSRLGTVTVQWRREAEDGTWVDVEGATALTLDLVATAGTDGAAYLVHVQNETGEAWSDPATVSVRSYPWVRVDVVPRAELADHLPGWT